MDTKVCNGCNQLKTIDEYTYRLKGGKYYLRSSCKECQNKRRSQLGYKSRNLKLKAQRANGENREYFIHTDSKSSDKKNGREYGLSIDIISGMINTPCSYCGDEHGLRTLDRIDNTVGHVIGNVLPSCLRCNMVRGNMPMAAWLVIASAMKDAREQNLFGDWGLNPPNQRKMGG